MEVIRKKEQDLVLQILNKASCLKSSDQPLEITSVSFIEKSPGVIFIESYSVAAIQAALDGISGIISRKF